MASFAFWSHLNEDVPAVSVSMTSVLLWIGEICKSLVYKGTARFACVHNDHTKKSKVWDLSDEAACFCRSADGSGNGVSSIYGTQTGACKHHTVVENGGLMELKSNFVLTSKRKWEASSCSSSNSVTLKLLHPRRPPRSIEQILFDTNRVILPRNSICPLNRQPNSRLSFPIPSTPACCVA